MVVGSGIFAYLTAWKLTGHALYNRPLIYFGLLFVIVGVQLISIGLLGEMITSTAARPTYSLSKRELD
jgi:hypothetical protein